MATFLLELQEHVRVFNRELLALEQGREGEAAREAVKTLFRAAHSLKGAARSVNATELEAICHELEELLASIRDGKRAFDAEVFARMFASVDAIQVAAERLRSSSEAKKAEPLRPAPVALERDAAPLVADAKPATVVESAPRPARAASNLPPTSTRSVAREYKAPSADAVRIPGKRLDGLLAQSGELLIARRRFELRQNDVHALGELLARFRNEFRSADAALKRALRDRPTAPSNGHAHEAGRDALLATAELAARATRIAELTRDYLVRLERELERLTLGLAADSRSLSRAAAPLEEQIHEARLLPLIEACEGLQRSVRDLALAQHKEVELVLEGMNTELDRSIVDRLRDPLLHLVRNAVDHGIEPPALRVSAGKPARGQIGVSAALRGELVEVTIADDGRGLDLVAIRAEAERRGFSLPNDDRELGRLIFEPGLSTASVVTEVSGRGVGLDVVRDRVEAIRGHIEVTTERGAGTRFVLSLPLTLTSARVLLVSAAGETLAIPSSAVHKLVRIGAADLRKVEGREVLSLGDAPIPVTALSDVLGLGPARDASLLSKLPAVVLGVADTRVVFTVDELQNEQDVVLKPLGRRIGRMPHVSAATLLSSGRIALLLKPADLIRSALFAATSHSIGAHFAKSAPKTRRRLLLVDDSVTTRTLEKSILEAAGYEVVAAPDGAAGFALLQERGADLLLSDVEMPNMDGFTLTRSVRASKRFERLPIVLLTALESEADRARGLAAGADVYLSKGAFDQATLLETIRQLLPP